jgi:hypothetical protein
VSPQSEGPNKERKFAQLGHLLPNTTSESYATELFQLFHTLYNKTDPDNLLDGEGVIDVPQELD